MIDALLVDGHDVTVASSKKFESAVTSLGCAHTPVGIDWLESELDDLFPGVRQAGVPNHRKRPLMETTVFAGATAEAALPDLHRYVEDASPELIVRGGWEFASCVVADRTGIPLVTVNPLLFGRRAFNRLFSKPLSELASRRVKAYDFVRRFPSVLTTPSSFVLRHEEVPPNAKRFQPPRPPIVKRQRNVVPRVHVSLGTVVHRAGLYQAVLDALRPIECHVIVAAPTSVTDTLRTDPDVELHSFVDHAALLPTCDVFIHHGGIGSVLASLDHRVPVVVLPGWADQPRNAAACEQMGFGNSVAMTDQRVESIREAIQATLDERDSHCDALEQLAQEAASYPALGSALPWILSFA